MRNNHFKIIFCYHMTPNTPPIINWGLKMIQTDMVLKKYFKDPT